MCSLVMCGILIIPSEILWNYVSYKGDDFIVYVFHDVCV